MGCLICEGVLGVEEAVAAQLINSLGASAATGSLSALVLLRDIATQGPLTGAGSSDRLLLETVNITVARSVANVGQPIRQSVPRPGQRPLAVHRGTC